MSNPFNVLWLSASPSLQCLNRPLQRLLLPYANIRHWQYYQDLDEASSAFKAVDLLRTYLSTCEQPLHLIGHGLSGTIGLLYARQYPEKVKSLTLLSVAAQPGITWHSHYYAQRHLLPCSRQQVLAQTVRNLFGSKSPYPVKALVHALEQDLEKTPCLQSLFNTFEYPKGGIVSPLMVCGSRTDSVVDLNAQSAWLPWLKTKDVLWSCQEGYHFFHYFHPQLVGEKILRFWNNTTRELRPIDRVDSSTQVV
ncbi:MAG: alpha/beta hydrolase [Thermosynechococcaceae cyanobacterium]